MNIQEEVVALVDDHGAGDDRRPGIRARRRGNPIWDKNRAEEPILIRAWQERACSKSLDLLIRRYAPLFNAQISRILSGRSLGTAHIGDLRQEATLAFVQAVNAYDPTMEYHLSALATNYVRNALLRYALDFRSSYRTGTSSGERKAYYAAQALRARKTAAGESYFTDAEIEQISRHTGASMRSTKRAVAAVFASEMPIEDAHDIAEDQNPIAAVEDETSRERAMRHVHACLEQMNPRSRTIIEETFLTEDPATTSALAERFDVSVERIGQLRRAALTDLAIHLKSQGLTAAAV